MCVLCVCVCVCVVHVCACVARVGIGDDVITYEYIDALTCLHTIY